MAQSGAVAHGRIGLAAGNASIQIAAAALGVVFLLVGAAGFTPGITTEFDRLGTFDDEGAKLLGLFGVNWLENLVHVAYGVGGLMLATTARRSWLYFIGGGALYLLIALYGFFTDVHSDANFLGVNVAGTWLHLALGLAMIGVGVFLNRDGRRP